MKAHSEFQAKFIHDPSGQSVTELGVFLAIVGVLIVLISLVFNGGVLSPKNSLLNEFNKLYSNLNTIQD